MSSELEPESKQGRMHTIVSALKSLLLEDPLIFIIVVAFLLPLAGITYDSVLKLDIAMALFSIGISFVIVILVLIPLIIFRNKKQHSNELQKITKGAIEAEAQTRLESEKTNTNIKFQLMLAKINHIETETQFILEQSERHERKLLQTAGKEIAEGMQLEFDKMELVDREEYKQNLEVVVATLKKQEDQYDDIIIKFNNLTGWLETISDTKIPEPEAEFKVVGKIGDKLTEPEQKAFAELDDKNDLKILDETVVPTPLSDAQIKIAKLNAVIKNKDEDIAHLLQDLEGGNKNYFLLQTERDKLQVELEAEKAKGSLTERIKDKVNLKILKKGQKPEVAFKEESVYTGKDKTILEEALDVVDSIKDGTEKTEAKPEESIDLATEAPGNDLTVEEVSGVPIIEEQAKSVVWVCKCKRENEISKLRCSSCGAGKPINNIDDLISAAYKS